MDTFWTPGGGGYDPAPGTSHALVGGAEKFYPSFTRESLLGLPANLSPLRTKLIKCHFQLGSEPLWAWVCSVLDPQNAINELMNCV